MEAWGRQVRGQCALVHHTAGAVTLTVATPLATRLAIARRSALGATVDAALGGAMPAMDAAALGLGSLEVLAAEPTWGWSLLTNAGARGAVEALFRGATRYEGVVLALRPGALVLKVDRPDHDHLDVATIAFWLGALFAFLQAAEGMPLPAQRLEPSRLERLADDPRAANRIVLAIVGGVLLLGILGALVAAAVLMLVV